MKDKVDELRRILKMQDQTPNQDLPETPIESEGPSLQSSDQMANDATDTSQPSELELLQTKYEDALAESKVQKEQYMRTLAEFENYKKRLKKEQDEYNKYANQKILEELFPVIDSFEMILSHIQDENDPIASGVKLTLKQFLSALEKYGVKQISGEGENFDPNLQEAIGTQKEANIDPGKVIKVLRKGYQLSGKLVRAAMVMVSQ